jgi:hypothetical protein
MNNGKRTNKHFLNIKKTYLSHFGLNRQVLIYLLVRLMIDKSDYICQKAYNIIYMIKSIYFGLYDKKHIFT